MNCDSELFEKTRNFENYCQVFIRKENFLRTTLGIRKTQIANLKPVY